MTYDIIYEELSDISSGYFNIPSQYCEDEDDVIAYFQGKFPQRKVILVHKVTSWFDDYDEY